MKRLEHNPDPLSSAQQGLVDVVADLVPWLRQRAVCGYLYWAVDPNSKRPTTSVCHTRETFHSSILPTCEALLIPLERRILANDGALSDELLADPSRCELTLPDAIHVYRSIYRQYVGQLGPAIKHARAQLDALLHSQLGEPLSAHGALLSGIGGAQTDRVSLLWQLGRDGCPPESLRRFLARFGAFSNCWDVLSPCDDEQPHAVREYAQHLARLPSTPSISHALSLAHYHDALQKLLDRLPRLAKEALKSLLPLVRDAMVVAEDDDLLFFRAQRLVRWALLGLGARLHQTGRIDHPTLIFDLPWHTSSRTDLLQHADRPDPTNLSTLAEHERSLRIQAKRKIPPGRIAWGRPEWTLPDGQTLSGTGTGAGVVAGVALQGGGAGDVLDLVLLEQERDPARQALDRIDTLPVHRRKVEAHLVDLDAQLCQRSACCFVIEFRGMEHRLGRDAPDVEADAAPVLGFDDGGVQSELGGADGGDISAGAGTEHDDVIVSHGSPA